MSFCFFVIVSKLSIMYLWLSSKVWEEDEWVWMEVFCCFVVRNLWRLFLLVLESFLSFCVLIEDILYVVGVWFGC